VEACKGKVLIVDDAKFSVTLLSFDLEKAGFDFKAAYDGPEALDMLKTEEIDIVLLDVHMPTMSGLEVLEEIKQNPTTATIPVIMLSASENENEIVNALDLGADDYVTKPYISKVLLARMRTALRLKDKNAELERMASTDFLTGLTNRRLFKTLTLAQIEKNKRDGGPMSLAMIDIDHFKMVNDNHGHDAGDLVLIAISNLLRKHFRGYDVVARIGGEEFAIMMPDTPITDAEIALERLRQKIEETTISLPNQDVAIKITVSIGVTWARHGRKDYDELLSLADQSLYKAKNAGRNRVVFGELTF
jgi:diguanylate cyclase (GGDEF)-like protein